MMMSRRCSPRRSDLLGPSVFSSRRRHTRYIGDWSSDVCSSDLTCGVAIYLGAFLTQIGLPGGTTGAILLMIAIDVAVASWFARSEERRVGKGCRRRWLGQARKEKPGQGSSTCGWCCGRGACALH